MLKDFLLHEMQHAFHFCCSGSFGPDQGHGTEFQAFMKHINSLTQEQLEQESQALVKADLVTSLMKCATTLAAGLL